MRATRAATRAQTGPDPHGAAALIAQGQAALDQADPAMAALLFGQAAMADPGDPAIWVHIASAQQALGDAAGLRSALRHALLLDPQNLPASLAMAEDAERQARPDLALPHWRIAAAAAERMDDVPAEYDAPLERAAARVESGLSDFHAHVDAVLAGPRAGHAPAEISRFDACVDNLLGRAGETAAEGRHIPALPAQPFFGHDQIAWLEQLEAHADAIRAELIELIAAPPAELAPYVALPAGGAEPEWSHLDGNADWSAYHLWRHGERIAAACLRCPRTAAAIDALPMMHLAGRTPNVFFSILRPGTRLPAHVGVTNIRTVVHLALIVPEGCGLRVGAEVREWREGEAFGFDDTIDHEAWNLSGELRAVLIADAWNPHLTAVERELLGVFAAGTYSARHDMRRLAL